MKAVLRHALAVLAALLPALLPALLGACGGGNPVGNPPDVANPAGSGGSNKLSFAYYQRCVHPVLVAQLTVVQNGQSSVNTCASAGCHASATGSGGSLRLLADAGVVDLSDAANTAAVIRATDMYRNFYSAQAATLPGTPLQSRLLQKPLLLNVLHGGGLVFASVDDANAQRIAYWISHPVPADQDEFAASSANLFTPADPMTGACNS